MAEEVFYKKEGRKYVPVSYYDSNALNGVPQGATLIVKQGHLTMRKYDVDIESAPLVAAVMSMQDRVSSAIHKETEARPHTRQLTEQERDDWQKLIDKHGELFRYMEYASCREIAENLLTELQKDVEKAHTNPSVKEAFEHYKFLLALTVKEQNEQVL
jgi:hypothetical protein